MYLVPLWALYLGLMSRMGWALLSSKVSRSGLSGALLFLSSSFGGDKSPRFAPPRWGAVP